MVTTYPRVPADGVEFELTLEATDPLEMVRLEGGNSEGWSFRGSPIVPQTSRFKLIRARDCWNLHEVRVNLNKHGSIPGGQWREAFRKAFPQCDGKGPIGFADASWVNPTDCLFYPVLDGKSGAWESYFCPVYFDTINWRWLVEISK